MSSSVSSVAGRVMPRPALLTHTSMRPKRASAAADDALDVGAARHVGDDRQRVRRRTGAPTAAARRRGGPPAPPPRRACQPSASAAPMPLLAPVITTTCSLMRPRVHGVGTVPGVTAAGDCPHSGRWGLSPFKSGRTLLCLPSARMTRSAQPAEPADPAANQPRRRGLDTLTGPARRRGGDQDRRRAGAGRDAPRVADAPRHPPDRAGRQRRRLRRRRRRPGLDGTARPARRPPRRVLPARRGLVRQRPDDAARTAGRVRGSVAPGPAGAAPGRLPAVVPVALRPAVPPPAPRRARTAPSSG